LIQEFIKRATAMDETLVPARIDCRTFEGLLSEFIYRKTGAIVGLRFMNEQVEFSYLTTFRIEATEEVSRVDLSLLKEEGYDLDNWDTDSILAEFFGIPYQGYFVAKRNIEFLFWKEDWDALKQKNFPAAS